MRPDHGGTSHLPGQYATLGLGYWEPRIDDATDASLDDRWLKLIRRSYSISSPIFDEHGYLTDAGSSDELEFYIVLVTPTNDNVPALTPRLALKRAGDRVGGAGIERNAKPLQQGVASSCAAIPR